MCCWMGSRSHDWNGVANFRNFRGKKHSGKQGFKKWKIRGQNKGTNELGSQKLHLLNSD